MAAALAAIRPRHPQRVTLACSTAVPNGCRPGTLSAVGGLARVTRAAGANEGRANDLWCNPADPGRKEHFLNPARRRIMSMEDRPLVERLNALITVRPELSIWEEKLARDNYFSSLLLTVNPPGVFTQPRAVLGHRYAG